MRSATDALRRLRPATAALAAVALVGGLLTACTPDFLLGGAGSDGGPGEQDCVAQGYPCSWSEADDGVLERSELLLRVAHSLARAGESAGDIAGRLEAAPDVRDVRWDDYGIQFRVDGGMPVVLDLDPHGDPDDPILAGGGGTAPERDELPSLAELQGEEFLTCEPSGAETDGLAGVTRSPGEGKQALLLSPSGYELPWNIDHILTPLIAEGSRYSEAYGGRVVWGQTEHEGGSIEDRRRDNLVPSNFCGWEQYDTIMLLTHGRALCTPDDDQNLRCLTSFKLGEYSESLAELERLVGQAIGITFGVSEFSGFSADLTAEEKAACDVLVEEVVQPDGFAEDCMGELDDPIIAVQITSDFFAANYPEGLPDRIIFLAACQGMKFDDMARALGRGGSGMILGFDKIALLRQAQGILYAMTTRIGQRERIGEAFLGLANTWLDGEGGKPDLIGTPLGPGGDDATDVTGAGVVATWGSDVVGILSGGVELVDGGVVELGEPTADADRLRFELLLTDVTDGESPDDYQVEVLWNGIGMNLPELTWRADGVRYTAEAEIEILKKLDEGERFDLEIRASLPAADGAPTWWRYEDLTAGAPDPCSRLTDAEVVSALGYPVAPTEGGGGFGDFFGGLCGWQTPEGSANESSLQILVEAGGAAAFRESADGSPDLVDGFGDVALYEPTLGRGDDCPLSTGPGGESHWACFVNLTVALGPDTLHVVLDGDVVGESGPDGSLDILRAVIAAMRS